MMLPYRSVEALSSYTASSGDGRSASSTVRFLGKKTNRRSRLHKVHQTDLQVPENQSAASDESAGSSHQGIRLLFPHLSQELFH